MEPTLPVTIASNANEPPKMLLDLPDDLLLPILAHVPIDRRSLRNLRMVCRRINDLTHTKALYREVARTQFPDTSALFFIELTAVNMVHTGALQREFDKFVSCIMRRCRLKRFAVAGALQSVVKRGIALLWWLGYHAIESPSSTAVFPLLLDLVKTKQLDFTAMLAIRMATICMFESIRKAIRVEIIEMSYQYLFWALITANVTEQDHDQLFFAFESAVLWTRRYRTTKLRERLPLCSDDYMRASFGAMIQPTGLSALYAPANQETGASASEPWAVFPALLKENAPSCRKMKQVLGSDLHTLTDTELYHRMKDLMKQETLAEAVLKRLDLDKLGQSARLKGNTFETPSFWYWAL